jgi:hypothetical protein
MKLKEDVSNPDKVALDYYDFIIVDAHIFEPNAYLLINISIGSGNEGKVFAMIENVFTRGFIPLDIFIAYFRDHENLYVMQTLDHE